MKSVLSKKISIIFTVFYFVLSSTMMVNGDIIDLSNGKGAILYVGGSGPGNYSTIQDAIDNSSPDDMVFVFNGTYYENIQINVSIHLIGEQAITTIIDGEQHDHVINIGASNVRISLECGKTCCQKKKEVIR